jgi:2-oxoglutarate dehydrogenase E2 component (dihydrolipoamide succinyltransferase)
MTIELKVPHVGESIQEVQIGHWLKQEGDRVEVDEDLVELETDKATMELPAPAAGVLRQILKRQGDAVAVGETIAVLEEGDGKPPAQPKPKEAAKTVEKAAPKKAEPKQPAQAEPVAEPELGFVAPPVEAPPPEAAKATGIAPKVRETPSVAGEDEEIVPMTLIRRRIAEHLVEAQRTAALLTTFNEIDMSAVKELRQKYGEKFRERYGIKLGFMSFFVKAAIDALKAVPVLNAEIRGNDIVYRKAFHMGIAIATDRGLVVPVLKHAERMNFAETEQAIEEFAVKARGNKLSPDDLVGGTFTISNGGVYGSLLSTPIVNPPQSGVLGMHAIQDRPVAVKGQVAIRPMMYVALTYDHRIVDGREAVTFLRRIKETVEEPSRMLLET